MVINAAMIGAGQRGFYIYGQSAVRLGDVRFVAVVDPDPARRDLFGDAHSISTSARFESVRELETNAGLLEAWFVASPDRAHIEAVRAGMHSATPMFLEKPIVTNPRDLAELALLFEAQPVMIQVAHVLRYSPLYRTVHEIIASGRLGRIVSVLHEENVSAKHMAHSYVRGNWGRAESSSPMLIAKSSHDLDIILWNMPTSVTEVFSWGSLLHFRGDQAPSGATSRCTDGCPVVGCVFDARDQYLGDNVDWPVHAITSDLSLSGRRLALETGPYGRCVYHSDNDVVDNQVVTMRFADGATGAFRMHGHSDRDLRTMRYDGTLASLRASDEEGHQWVEVMDHRTGETDRIAIVANPDDDPHGMGHGGGDEEAIRSFAHSLITGAPSPTGFAESLRSHWLAFAAEESRATGRAVDVDHYRSAQISAFAREEKGDAPASPMTGQTGAVVG